MMNREDIDRTPHTVDNHCDVATCGREADIVILGNVAIPSCEKHFRELMSYVRDQTGSEVIETMVIHEWLKKCPMEPHEDHDGCWDRVVK